MKIQFKFKCCFVLLSLMSCGNSIQIANDNHYAAETIFVDKSTLSIKCEESKSKHNEYEILNGWLTKNIPEKTIIDSIGTPDFKGEDVYWEGTANYVQKWEYRNLGLILLMESDESGGEKRVFHIEVNTPSLYKTSLGIGIGSPKARVLENYANEINKEESESDAIVIGSIYGGTCFFIKDGIVCRIFIGELAE